MLHMLQIRSCIVSWHLFAAWSRCLCILDSLDIRVSHIYREGNACVDQLASEGLSFSASWWSDFAPIFCLPFLAFGHGHGLL